jgi:glycosyltransferase involved in cell wall biosynthesis
MEGEMPIEQIAADDVAIVIPMLNEAAVTTRLLRLLAVLVPALADIIAVDGGSQDETVALVRASGFVRAVEHPVRGRAAAIIACLEASASKPMVRTRLPAGVKRDSNRWSHLRQRC